MIVYRKREFVVCKYSNKKKPYFIVINQEKEFSEGHTHMQNFYMAKKIISCVISKKIDHNFNSYVLTSMSRINNDKLFDIQIENEINRITQQTLR